MKEKMVTTIGGLSDTALEKIMSLGYEEAREDLEKIRNMIDDLVFFWDLDQELLEEFDKRIEVCK